MSIRRFHSHQVRFFEVSEEELEQQRLLFSDGQLALGIEESVFDMAEYNAFVEGIATEVAQLKATQRKAAAEQVGTRSDGQTSTDAQAVSQSVSAAGRWKVGCCLAGRQAG
jgi:urea carboxylase